MTQNTGGREYSCHFDTECYVAMDKRTGGHCFAYTVVPYESLSNSPLTEETLDHLQRTIFISHEKMSFRPIWQEVGPGVGSADEALTDPSDFLNELIRCKDAGSLYQIASKYGPLKGLTVNRIRPDGQRTFMECDDFTRSERLLGVMSGGPFDLPESTGPHLEAFHKPNADMFLKEFCLDLPAGSRSYPGAARKVVEDHSFVGMPPVEGRSYFFFSEPIADWLLLRNLLQSIGRIQTGLSEPEGAGDSGGEEGLLERWGFTVVRRDAIKTIPFSPERLLDFKWEVEFREKGAHQHADSFWCLKKIATVRTDMISRISRRMEGFAKLGEGGPQEFPELMFRATSGSHIALGTVFPLLRTMTETFCSYAPGDASRGMYADFLLPGFVSNRPFIQYRAHIVLGCQGLAKRLSLPLKENDVCLAIECRRGIGDFPDGSMAWRLQDRAARNAVLALVHYLRNHLEFDDDVMLRAIEHDELHYGEIRHDPRWLADKAIASLFGHEGRKLIVCKNCGRISLAPAQGKPRQFCSASCQHMYAKRNAK